MTSNKTVRSAFRSARVAFFVSIWFTLLSFIGLWYLTTAILLVIAPRAGLVSLAVLLATLLIPLDQKTPRSVEWLLENSIEAFVKYLPVNITLHGWKSDDANVTAEQATSKSNKLPSQKPPYIIAYEPHGVLPLIMCIFSGSMPKPATLALPPQLDHAAILASDAVFWVPILRNIWYWLGLRSVSRESIDRLLDEKKTSVVLCPGGITECLVMQPYNESVYLKSRTGFIRMAKKHGASIVPVFAIGQSAIYAYWRPLYDAPSTAWSRRMFIRLSKLLKFVPMVAWGRWGSPLPYQERVNVVIGSPIEVEEADHEGDVEGTLSIYIDRLREMYETHGNSDGAKALAIF